MSKSNSALVYELPLEVGEQHIDDLNHVNNIVYVQWVQETAGAHWLHATSNEEQRKYLWVVLRHEIDYHKPAFVGDEIFGRTWVEKMEGAKSFRHVEIRRGDDVLVKSVTTWAMLDSETGKPARVPQELALKFIRA